MQRHISRGITLSLSIMIMVWNYSAHAKETQELQLSHRYSNLTAGFSDWSDWRLFWSNKQDADNAYYVQVNDIYHFAIRDQQIAVGKHYNRSGTLHYQTEVTASTAHTLYPVYSLFAGIEASLSKPLKLNTGLKFSHFDKTDPLTMLNSSANSLLFNSRFDYYTGNNLFSYSLYFTQMQGLSLSDNVTTHSIKYAYIYNDINNIYLSYAQGDEIDFDPANAALSSSTIQTINLGGMHWVNQGLAIIYTVARHHVSSTSFGYQRNELYIGIRQLY